MKKTMPFLLLFLASILAEGQNSKLSPFAEELMFDENKQVNYVRFKETYRVKESQVEAYINTLLFKEDFNKVGLLNTERDEIGYTHYRYQVLQNGIPVANKMIIAHCREGKLVSVNGDLNEIAQPVNGFVLTEADALKAALAKVNATQYMWESKFEEELMRETSNDPNFTYFPEAKKVVLEQQGKTYNAYVFNIYAQTPMYRANVFVDAASGLVLDEQNLLCMIDVPGTANTKYSGTQTITCDQTGPIHSLKESVRGIGLGVETRNLNNGTNFGSWTSFTSTTSNFTTTGFDQGATDAHWGAEKTYDYFWLQHNRNSINNSGFRLVSYVHYGNNWQNASWDGQRMRYGDGNGSSTKMFSTLDICGHEITHGLTSNSSNLVYSNESGALNESYSDIFGNSIENFARPGNWNWKVGEDMTTSGNGLRSMSNPNADGNPDTYKGSNWYSGTGDNGGVHTNSGVSNFWYYLLVTGGSGTNDLGNAYNVNGIGFTSAGRIAYRALTNYYGPGTNYANARNLSIQAAKDLFGDCSNEVIQTINAWHAVGIGTKYTPGTIAPEFTSASTVYCELPASASFYNLTNYGNSYVWDFGDGSPLYTGQNATHTYTNSGTYNVKLKTTGCTTDSITKTAYISINVLNPPVSGNIISCENTAAVLTATGSSTIKWSSDPQINNVIASGNTFTSPILTSAATYYAANSLTFSPTLGGKATNTSGGGYLTTVNNYLIFDVVQPGTLNSVVMVAGTPGVRTIEMKDAFNNVVTSTTVNLGVGTHTVNLYFQLMVGNDYQLGLAAGSAAYIYRNTSGVTYPYNIGSCVSITNSSAGPDSYFWFYDWEVTRNDCHSPSVPVAVQIDQCVGIKKLSSDYSDLQVYPNPAKDQILLRNPNELQGLFVKISDVTGRIVYSASVESVEETVELQNFANGLYMVNFSDASGNSIKTTKLVKE